MQKHKLDNFFIGLAGGLILPFLSICVYWLWGYSRVDFYPHFFRFLLIGHVLSAVISLCIIPNMGLFFLFLNKEFYRSCKGMILASLLYGFLIVYLKIWVEHSFTI